MTEHALLVIFLSRHVCPVACRYGQRVDVVTRFADADEAGIIAPEVLGLLGELSSSAHRIDATELAARMHDDRVRVVLGYLDDRLVATATLTLLVTLAGGLTGRVEDVVVSEAARGHGVGRQLMLALHAEARRLGLRQLDLTSRPTREAANHLYRSLGYERHETNVYRLTL